MSERSFPPVGEAHLWLLELQQLPIDLSVLAPYELRRFEALRSEDERYRYGASHCALREILSLYLSCGPAEIELCQRCQHCGREGHGPLQPVEGLSLSLSHSGVFVAVAVQVGGRIGVDVEMWRPQAVTDIVAALSGQEQRSLSGLTGDELTAAAFAVWTQKEAYLKAIGQGLMVPLDSFSVTVPPLPPALCNDKEGWNAFTRRRRQATVALFSDSAGRLVDRELVDNRSQR